MTSITTKLVKDGNSMAVRLPKTLLVMSGLYGFVQLEAKKGQIIIKQDKKHPRENWEEQINKVLTEEAHVKDDDFADMSSTIADGLNDLPWDGPTYKEWQKQHAKK
jgi:antitoxin component of MazEF toxin-antitoxin module